MSRTVLVRIMGMTISLLRTLFADRENLVLENLALCQPERCTNDVGLQQRRRMSTVTLPPSSGEVPGGERSEPEGGGGLPPAEVDGRRYPRYPGINRRNAMSRALVVTLGAVLICILMSACADKGPLENQRRALMGADVHADGRLRESYGDQDIYDTSPDCSLPPADVYCYEHEVDGGGWVCEDVGPESCKPGPCDTCPEGTYCGPQGVCIHCESACAAKECGFDPCGGSCGTCRSNQICLNDSCYTKKELGEPCEMTWQCLSGICLLGLKEDSVCSVECDDGNCPAGYSCRSPYGETYYCIPDTCEPDCQDKACGFDGCYGNCGQCGETEECWGFECGPKVWPDNSTGEEGGGGSCSSSHSIIPRRGVLVLFALLVFIGVGIRRRLRV